MKRRLDAFSMFSYVFLLFVAVVVVLHFVFGFQYVVILTDSMKPTIDPGDLVVTIPVSQDDIHVGDVVLYRVTIGNSTYWITHRIVDVRTDGSGRLYYVTKGDNRKYADPWRVYPDQVVGRVILRVPWIGRIFLWANIIVAAAFLLLAATIAYEIGVLLVEGDEDFTEEIEENREKNIAKAS